MLINDKVLLRGLELSDLELLHSWMNDFTLIKSILRIKPSIKYQTQRWYEQLLNDETKIIFAIEDISSKKFIGCIGCNNIDYIDRKAEIYLYIGDISFRGKGYAKISLILFFNYMFNYYNLNKLYLNVREDNKAAINLYKKIGCKVEGLLIEDKFIDGKYINIIRMALLRSDFLK